jgi:hypothetical protein
MKKAREARAMVAAMRVVGNKEGKGSKGHGVGNKGGVRQRGKWRWQQERWQGGWWASNSHEGNGDSNGKVEDVGDGNGNKAGEQHRGKG